MTPLTNITGPTRNTHASHRASAPYSAHALMRCDIAERRLSGADLMREDYIWAFTYGDAYTCSIAHRRDIRRLLLCTDILSRRTNAAHAEKAMTESLAILGFIHDID